MFLITVTLGEKHTSRLLNTNKEDLTCTYKALLRKKKRKERNLNFVHILLAFKALHF